jgi:hypothetical protein
MGQQVIDKGVELPADNFGLSGAPASNTVEVPLSGDDAGSVEQANGIAAGWLP